MARGTAALVDRGELDGEVALSYVMWPTQAMEQASSVGTQEADEAGPDSHYAAWKT